METKKEAGSAPTIEGEILPPKGGPISIAEVRDERRIEQMRLTARLEFTAEQEQSIRNSIANGMSKDEFVVFIEVCKARKLSPLLKQIHPVNRWDGQKNCLVWSYQVGIDGFRAIAQRTGEYDGQDEPIFEVDPKGFPTKCTVKVYRKNIARPFVGVAHFEEYAQRKQDKTLTMMWQKMPHNQLAKCAEALALRKGFPEELSGLYTDDEMEQADAAVTTATKTPAGTMHGAPASDAQKSTYDKSIDALSRCTTDNQCQGLGRDVAAFVRAHIITAAQGEELKSLIAAKRAQLAADARAAVTPDNKKDGGADAPQGANPPSAPAGRTEEKPAAPEGVEAGASPEPAASTTPDAGAAAGGTAVGGWLVRTYFDPKQPKPTPACGAKNEDNFCSRASGHAGRHFDDKTDAEWGAA